MRMTLDVPVSTTRLLGINAKRRADLEFELSAERHAFDHNAMHQTTLT
jgi:hypothetical protein